MACRTLELFGTELTRKPDRYGSRKRLNSDSDTSLLFGAGVPRSRSRSFARSAERIVFTATTAMALVGALVGGLHLFAASPTQSSAKTFAVIIAPGENLWSIGQRYAAPGQSTADTVSEIRAANPSLSQGQSLNVGERILVPALPQLHSGNQ